MFLALLFVLALAEGYRRTRHRLRALRAALPASGRALASDARRRLGGVAGWEWSALSVITLGALALRLHYLRQPIRYDEAATWLDYASHSLGHAVSDYRFPNNHILHTVLVHVSAAVFGPSPWAIRLPALTFGVALVPLAWALGRALHGRVAALGGAALVAASASLVLYSTNARGYTLLGCLTLALAVLAVVQLREDSAAGWAAMALLAALGAWTIPTMLYPAAGIAVWLWLAARHGGASIGAREMGERLRWTAAGAAALSGVLYLPVVAHTGMALLVGNRFVRPQRRSEFHGGVPAFLGDVWTDWMRGWPVAVAVVAAIGMLIVLLGSRWRRGPRVPARQRIALLGAMASCALGIMIVNGRLPYVRVWLFLLPIALVEAAGGITRAIAYGAGRLGLSRRRGELASLVYVLLLAIAGGWRVLRSDIVGKAEDTGTLRDGAAIAALLADSIRPHDRIIASAPSDLPLAFHLARRGHAAALRAFPDSARQLWIVVNDASRQHVPSLLRGAEIVGRDFGRAALVAAFPEARVFRVPRIRPGCRLDPLVCR